MGYLHIPNLYSYPEILEVKAGYALEKVHGTSAHVKFSQGSVSFFSGGASYTEFEKLFNKDDLLDRYGDNHYSPMTVYGEAYGGKMQGMSRTYGKELRFIAFDVRVGDEWLSVPRAEIVVINLGLEFVPWVETMFKLESLDALRDLPSKVGERRGCPCMPREGIVLRPFMEQTDSHGNRLIAKHKSAAFSETRTVREVKAPSLEKLEATNAALEWVTEERLKHVMDRVSVKLAIPLEKLGIENTGEIIRMMVDDVFKESSEDEVPRTKEMSQEIGRRAAKIWKIFLDTPQSA